MAIRMKENVPAKRIYWNKPIREKLAKGVAETLLARQIPFPPSHTDVMRAFRDTQPIILEPELRRDLRGPSQIPWLREAVIQAWPILSPPTIYEREHQTIITADDTDLVLDSLTSIEQTIAKFTTTQESHGEMIISLTDAVKALGREVKGLAEVIIKQRQRAKALVGSPVPSLIAPSSTKKSVRIVVSGLATGRQRREIEDQVKGHTHGLDLIFIDGARDPSQITHADQIIIMERLMGTMWHKMAEKLYPGRVHTARGIRATSDLIQQMGQSPEKYRAE